MAPFTGRGHRRAARQATKQYPKAAIARVLVVIEKSR
jgi:hypothetical protein